MKGEGLIGVWLIAYGILSGTNTPYAICYKRTNRIQEKMKNKNEMLFLVATLLLFFTSSVSHAAETLSLGYTNLRGAKVPVPLGVEEEIFARHGIELKMAPVSPGTLGVPKL